MATTRTTRSRTAAATAPAPAKTSTAAKPAAKKATPKKAASKKSIKEEPKEESGNKPVANISRKRKRDVKAEDGSEDAKPSPKKTASPKSKTKKGKGPSEKDLQAGADLADSLLAGNDSPKGSSKKKNSYGLESGVSPFPDYPHPTPEECQTVNDILEKVHGKREQPKTIPTPSLEVSGCGEVPSVLDALIRTRLSAATNNANSNRAFQGLVSKFKTIKSGVGKGSVDWNRVRLAPQKEVFEAIKTGGLADVKSRDIKKILDLVYEENQQRRANIEKGEKASDADKKEETEERKLEVEKANAEVLSLDHLHLMGNEEAFAKLITYPGIGPKTASCVLLFCMQRPSFAVDTHVFRLTTWLGWVPTEEKARAMAKAHAAKTGEKPKAAPVNRETTYAHCDVRVPDNLKYPLHYLLIQHGKQCGWCSAKSSAARRVGTCPLAHLMSGKGRNKGLPKKVKEEDLDEDNEEPGDDTVPDDSAAEEEEDDDDDDDEVKKEEEEISDGDEDQENEEDLPHGLRG